MKSIKLICAIIFSFFLFSCTEKQENKAQHPEPAPAPVVHHEKKQNNEQMQDIYSKYMQTTPVDYVIFNSDEIRKTLGKQTIPDGIYGKIYIERIETRQQGIFDTFTSKEEIINYYDSKFSDKPCKENNVQGLICFKNSIAYRYFYLPNIDKDLSKERNFPSFLFSCGTSHLNCKSIPILSSPPYNIGVSIHFNHPKNIFYVLDYIDQHFYNTLGVYLWQPLPKKK